MMRIEKMVMMNMICNKRSKLVVVLVWVDSDMAVV